MEASALRPEDAAGADAGKVEAGGAEAAGAGLEPAAGGSTGIE